MNKNVLAVFALVCGLFMISCSTPSDQRPNRKASVGTVAPGMRNTFNVSDAGADGNDAHGQQTRHDDVMLNHDPGANTIQKGDSVPEAAKANEGEGVDNR